jgi:hypothetical protein
MWQTSTIIRAEIKKQIDNSIRDKRKINAYENEFEMIVSCGRSSTLVRQNYVLFCATRENNFYCNGSTVHVGPRHISGEVSTAHSDTPHSVG